MIYVIYTSNSNTVYEGATIHMSNTEEKQKQFVLQPATADNALEFYSKSPEEDAARGSIGYLRMDFGHAGREFWHTWFERGDGAQARSCTVCSKELSREKITLARVDHKAGKPIKENEEIASYLQTSGIWFGSDRNHLQNCCQLCIGI